ncbi:MAG: tRNA (adenosine(37)-N6)-dimethylallyltransferase MiaA [Bacteroidetes bacterium]|nr:MAG: tRNA (adenosine(37)-N6)-dimethylallyltransferase MiaA [Bacteroidota bacterium]
MTKTLLCILGPTAVGKTAAAIRLAQQLNTEIISADSRQFYQEVSIGTAKPSKVELDAIPHHFIGHLSIHQPYSAGDFERDALAKLEQLFTKHDVVIAVGGSGLYVKALVDGLDDMPKADEALRIELNEVYATAGIAALQQRLLQLNPDLANYTEMQNPQRVMRAIEIAIAKENGFIPNSKKNPRNFRTIKVVLNLPREQLYQRINLRVDSMMEQGLLEEARSMIPYQDFYALQTVGYKELFDYFDQKHTLQEAINLIKQHTRNYAKRQLTWFKKEAPDNWFEPDKLDGLFDLLKDK